jgi:hypothetical protein
MPQKAHKHKCPLQSFVFFVPSCGTIWNHEQPYSNPVGGRSPDVARGDRGGA